MLSGNRQLWFHQPTSDKCRRREIVAEGVETEEQFYILQQKGCEQAQGYLFSKPISIQEYEERFITGLKK